MRCWLIGGRAKYFKKKEEAGCILKTDSYVVESTVHFPTDYNLLWDGSRKSLELVKRIQSRHEFLKVGWRKWADWKKRLKKGCRQVGRISARGGKNKATQLFSQVKSYLEDNEKLVNKLIEWMGQIPSEDVASLALKKELEDLIEWMIHHMDLLERRVLKGEKIPHSEKRFSLFEPYTEWIAKEKSRPNVELGKKLPSPQMNMD